MKKLAVLVSGTGSILEAMIRANIPVALVIADRQCKGLEIARSKGIETLLLERTFKKGFDRHAYTRAMAAVLQDRYVGLVAMAGFMTVFSPEIFESFSGRILNIHPSLLPSFKGEKAVADALAFGAKITGTTIHYATKELDAGPIVSQAAVRVLPGDTVTTLHERIKEVERVLYPQVVRELIEQ